MTIDELIKYIVYEECEHCAGLFCKQNKGCRYWNILEMLRELKWYREQNLIDRKGMKNRIIELVDSGLIRMYTDVLDAIDEYPKVDPPKEV